MAYLNTGYVVAGQIVEKVAGEPLFAFLWKRIFQPLGMPRGRYGQGDRACLPAGYRRAALGPVRVEHPRPLDGFTRPANCR